MSFGKNLQLFRKIYNGMTQEELAEKMGVSRQTISKWELDAVYPEISKAIELCRLFSCSMDELFIENMDILNAYDSFYSNARTEEIEEFRYVKYEVFSKEPENDAIRHMKEWAKQRGIREPQILGWDFPFLTQEQINVFHMHGYAAACILPPELSLPNEAGEIFTQKRQRYAVITVKGGFDEPFVVIPNAYKTLMLYMKVNGIEPMEGKDLLSCYEKEYEEDGQWRMDIYIAVKDQ